MYNMFMLSEVLSRIMSIVSVLILNLGFILASAGYELRNLAYSMNGPVSKYISSPTLIPITDGTENFPQTQQITHSAPKVVYWTPAPTIPWGTTEKVGEHTYRTYVGDDEIMSTADELNLAINKYRVAHGVGELVVSDTLCKLADMRIAQLVAIGGLDSHKGFKEYLANDSNWDNIPGFKSVGENNSYGYRLSGTHLIEWVFDADEEHRSNQMNPKWNRICTRISGTIVEIVFGQE